MTSTLNYTVKKNYYYVAVIIKAKALKKMQNDKNQRYRFSVCNRTRREDEKTEKSGRKPAVVTAGWSVTRIYNTFPKATRADDVSWDTYF